MKRTIRECDRHPKGEEVRADETILFRTADDEYEIDLCELHVQEFRAFEATLATWVQAGRSTSPAPEPAPRARNREENVAIRKWAPSVGIDLGTRGRIPDELRARYRLEVVAPQAHERWSLEASEGGHAPVPTTV